MKEIPLTKGLFARVSDEDYDELVKYKWHIHKITNRYGFIADREIAHNKSISMHRVVMNAQKGQMVDHIDHDTLNNQRENLRFCTNAENHYNMKPQSGRTSKYKGVSWENWSHRWAVSIKYKGHGYNLGRYDEEIDAAYAYDKKAKVFFGQFACLNFPDR